MVLRSHVDPILYSRFILLDEDDIGPEHVSACRAAKDSSELGDLFDDICKRHPDLMFHEAYHCFQGLRSPFLNRYALLAWSECTKKFELLSREHDDHRNWSVEIPELDILSRRACLRRLKGDGISIQIGQPITVLDIVEGVTSLIEWQLHAKHEHISATDLLLFQRWQKRIPIYRKIYDVVAEVIGPERALMSSAALGSAALYTSSPIRALGRLIGRIEKYLNNRDAEIKYDAFEPHERSWFIFEQLNHIGYEAEVNATRDLLDNRLFRLKFPWGPHYPRSHPLLAHLAMGLPLFSVTTDEPLQFLSLVHPERFTDVRTLFENNHLATMTTVKVKFNDGLVRTFGTIHPHYASSYGTDGAAGAAKDFVRFHTTILGVMRVASRGKPEQRTCELHACPEWRHNYCNAYVPTPLDYTRCKFLTDLRSLQRGFRQ